LVSRRGAGHLGITEETARAMLATASADADKAEKKVAKK
jgi:hypothetical protein